VPLTLDRDLTEPIEVAPVLAQDPCELGLFMAVLWRFGVRRRTHRAWSNFNSKSE